MAKPPELAATLARIDELLAKVDPDALQTLRPGAKPAQLAKLAKSLAVPDDVLAFFRWHDGQTKPARLQPDDNRTPLSIDRALSAWKFLGDPDEEIKQPWSKTWLPLLTNGAGDYLCVETAARGAGKLIAYFHDDKARPVQFASLAAWATSVVAELAKQKPLPPPGKRVVLDASATTWTKLKKPPTEAQLDKRPIGAAISWKTQNPATDWTWSHVFVKLESGTKKAWRTSRSRDVVAAIAKLQELSDRRKPPDDSYWKADSFAISFDAKETDFDDNADKLVRVEVYEGTVVVRTE
jgi:cell wall assembly regulator SMI1